MEQTEENKMGVMPENKLLISMSLPIMASMLVQALYNIVDSIFVARVEQDAFTAISLAFPIQTLMIAISVGTSVGVSALLSMFLGQKEFETAKNTSRTGVILMLISSMVFVLFGIFFSRMFFEVQTSDQNIISYGTGYLSICTILSMGVFGQVLMERLLSATGKTIFTMCSQGLGAIINIILDPVFIFGLGPIPALDTKGAAIATVIGQFSACTLAIFLNIKFNKEVSLNIRKFRFNGKLIARIYKIGIPSIIMQSIGSVMTFGFNRILLGFESTAAAVFGAYFKLQSFAFMPVLGLNNGMVPIIAYNYGAAKKDRIIKTIKLSIFYGMTIMICCFLAFQLIPGQLLGLFKADDNMLKIGVPALRNISYSFIFAGYCIVLASVFQALEAAYYSMIVSIARQLVVLLPVAYFLAQTRNINMVWYSFPIAEIISLIMSTFFFIRIYKKTIKNL